MFINKTIARIGFAMITNESDAGVEYDENITWLESGEAGGREFKSSPVGNTFTIDADGVIVRGGEVNNGYDIELTLLAIIDAIKEKWLGRQKTANGHVESGGVVSYPKFALAVAEETFLGDKKYDINLYPSCQVSERPEKAAKSNYETFDPEFPTYKIAARPRVSDKACYIEAAMDELPTSSEVFTPTITPSAQSGGSGSNSGSGGNSGSGS